MSSNNNSTLRKETSNITLNVSDISIYINVNKANNNVVMNISKMLTYNLTGNLIGSFVSGGVDASNLNDIFADWVGGWIPW